MAGELGNINYDQWRTSGPPDIVCGPDCDCEDCKPDWQAQIITDDNVLAATEASALINADADESEHAVQELALTARHYLKEYSKMRELAQRLASYTCRRVRNLGKEGPRNLATPEEVQLAADARKAFPFLISSEEVAK